MSRNRKSSKSSKAKGINQDMNNAEHAIKKDFERKSFKDSRRGRYNGEDWKNKKSSNDSSWYAKSEQLLRDAASVSFNNALGTGISNVLNSTSPYTIPGIMTFQYVTTPGYSPNNASAINLAARRLYTYVRHANSGSANYDSPDLMMYVYSVLEAAVIYYHCVRAYGTANVYAQTNRYLPDALLLTQGFNPDNLRQNLADFRYRLNVAAAKLNSLAIPNTLDIFKRAVWLVSGIYKDAETIKSQIYFFKPNGYRVYQEATSNNGGFLDYNNINYSFPNGQSYTYWCEILDTMLAKLVESEDIGIMAGDILKAFGQNNLYTFSGVSEEYVVLPQYNEEVLLEISNAMVANYSQVFSGMAFASSPAVLDITQNPNTNAIEFMPYFTGVNSTGNGSTQLNTFTARDKFLNIRNDSPTPSDVMIASRFMFGKTTIGTGDNPNVYLTDFGSEIITDAYLYVYENSGTAHSLQSIVTPTIVNNTLSSFSQTICRRSVFDWSPTTYVFSASNATGATDVFGDLSNVTSISNEVIKKMNDTALLSMLDVPSLTFG